MLVKTVALKMSMMIAIISLLLECEADWSDPWFFIPLSTGFQQRCCRDQCVVDAYLRNVFEAEKLAAPGSGAVVLALGTQL